MKNVILIIIGFLLFIGASIYCDVNNKDVYVNGTVIAKNEKITTHHKLIKVTTDYILKDPKWYDDKSTLCIIYVFIKLCGMALIILGYFAIIKNLNHKLLFN